MKRMRHCFWCGVELGVYDDIDSDPLDTCGKIECEREARNEARREREEAHEQLDRDLGWENN